MIPLASMLAKPIFRIILQQHCQYVCSTGCTEVGDHYFVIIHTSPSLVLVYFLLHIEKETMVLGTRIVYFVASLGKSRF